ncbi:MAG: cysteine desulfurase family protein [Chthoniobacterales bacterium]
MIYLDYNATTPLCELAHAAMQPYLREHFGNPSSIHAAGREARAAIDDARDLLADLLGAKPHELIFTAGGTEANNLAILGLARSRHEHGRHLICGSTEHHAVLNTFEHLQACEGFDVTFLRVDSLGRIEPTELAGEIRAETTLVSIMSANNETGVTQPMAAIAEVCRARGVLLHSDMVQSFGKEPTDLALVDAASFAAHKFYGPKGAGLLYLRAGLPLEPIQFGGAHENQRRPGTENVAAIAGMAAAAEFALDDFLAEQKREAGLRDQLLEKIGAAFPEAKENGDPAYRLGNTLNVSFPGVSSETLLIALDLEGVCASSGSACMVGSVVASHVLRAMGAEAASATSAIRFSLGKETSAAEIAETGAIIARVLSRLTSANSAKAYALA